MTPFSSTLDLPADPRHLLDNYPLIRSRSADEARELVGRALSPHRLDVRGEAPGFEARHNQIRLGRAQALRAEGIEKFPDDDPAYQTIWDKLLRLPATKAGLTC